VKDWLKTAMKTSWTFIGLVALSVLYLFEVDFSNLNWMNGAAFVIVAVTLSPLLVSIIISVKNFFTERKIKKEEKHKAEEAKALEEAVK
jgi:hypothetical protein